MGSKDPRYQRGKELVYAIKAHGCLVCGESDLTVLDLHHVKPEDKHFTLTGAALCKPLSVLEDEARKCVVLCANHHRLADAGMIEFDEGEFGVYDHNTTFRLRSDSGGARLLHDGR